MQIVTGAVNKTLKCLQVMHCVQNKLYITGRQLDIHLCIIDEY